jgi:hypothetical protein
VRRNASLRQKLQLRLGAHKFAGRLQHNQKRYPPDEHMFNGAVFTVYAINS